MTNSGILMPNPSKSGVLRTNIHFWSEHPIKAIVRPPRSLTNLTLIDRWPYARQAVHFTMESKMGSEGYASAHERSGSILEGNKSSSTYSDAPHRRYWVAQEVARGTMHR